jgi:glucose/arabinose dehydrogenase
MSIRRSSLFRLAIIAVLAALYFYIAGRAEIRTVSAEDSGVNSGKSATALTTELMASGFVNPVFVCSPATDTSRLFVLEQRSGKILIVKDGSVLARPFLDIGSLISIDANERGLLDMAFHPDYENNGYFYLNYTNSGGSTEIARYSVSSDPDSADISSQQVIMTISQPYSNHNGGMLAFSPVDGYLYISTGDGGSGGDPGDRAQDKSTLLGKLLRIDVDAGTPYANPDDNPFVDSIGMRDEIWALGLRNAWRFSFDSQTGDIYIGDVGQNAWEEIDYQAAEAPGGLNYGWRCYEGNQVFIPTNCGDPGNYIFPIHEYEHTDGACSVTGGYVYRGCALPDLQGTYFFGDFCNGRIWSFRYDGNNMTEFQDRTAELAPGGGMAINMISSFGADARSEIYIVDYLDGEIYRIVAEDGSTACPAVCGDVNGSGGLNLLDATYLINYLYKGGPAPEPAGSGDVNASGSINLLDATYLINHLYKGGPAPICP